MTLRQWSGYATELEFGMRERLAVLGLALLAMVAETFAVLSLAPVLQYVEARGDTERLAAASPWWEALTGTFAALGLEFGLGLLLVLTFTCVILRQVLLLARNLYTTAVRERLLQRLRLRGFSGFMRARSEWHDRAAAGDITNALTTEARAALVALMLPLEFLNTLALLGVYLGLLVALSPSLTATAVAALLIVVLPVRALMQRSLAAGRQMSRANSDTVTFLAQRLQSSRLIRLAGAEAAERAAIEGFTAAQRRIAVGIGRLQALADVMVEPFIAAVAFTLIYVGYTAFAMPLGTIGLFMAILLRLLPVVKGLVGIRQAMTANFGALETVHRRLSDMAAAAEPASTGRTFAGIERGVSLRDVTYTYPGSDRPALDRVDVEIPARRLTALVGPSGSGKSTLTDLLPRLREPQGGEILVDDVALAAFDRSSLRRAIAYVPQSPQIFNVTPAEHIRYGKPDADDEEIRRAAALAGADAFIAALPNGYDTPLGEGAVRLSGGQRQRLDLARALVRQAPLLILDEPTSNLDADSEALFRDTLLQVRQARSVTILVIAHRLTTVASADRIIVLVGGRVEAVGSHAKLMHKPNWYAQAYRQQVLESGGDAARRLTAG